MARWVPSAKGDMQSFINYTLKHVMPQENTSSSEQTQDMCTYHPFTHEASGQKYRPIREFPVC